MSRYTIPTSPLAPQTLTTTLSGKACTITLDYRAGFGMFLSLAADDVLITSGRICLNDTPIIRRVGTALPGDLYFHDTQGNSDPELAGLGTRWELIYDAGTS